jgi:hypothetical protein
MTRPYIFIGLVSHANSRFAASQGSQGLAKTLSLKLEDCGLTSDVQVNTENMYDSSAYPLSPRMSLGSVAGELELERVWHEFLGGKRSALFTARLALRGAKLALNRLRGGDTSVVERLLNIEYSHLDLMKSGLHSGASWILILEDDAGARDMGAVTDLMTFVAQSEPPPKIVSMSDSFSQDQLGVTHLLHPHGPTELHLFLADRPVTNTVCAVAYHHKFLVNLVETLDKLPIEPIVPIDWRINAALMELWNQGKVGPRESWFVDPAPIVQRSMHDGN